MLVFFIVMLFILLFINFLSIVLLHSKIKIEITTLKIEKKENEKIKLDDYIIIVYLALGKLKWLKVTINKEKLSNSKLLNNIKLKDFNKNNFLKSKDFLKLLKEIKLDYLDLKAEIGFDNIIALSYFTTILNIILSIILAKKGNIKKINSYKYKITPYNKKGIYYNLSLNCIFSIKFVNIINIILKKRGNINYERTSNRVFNGNCYE